MNKKNKLESVMTGRVSDKDRMFIAKTYDEVMNDNSIAYWKKCCNDASTPTHLPFPTKAMSAFELKDSIATYGATEAYLRAKGFDVKHLLRDARGDWGDDGGFIASVSVRDGDWYVHFLAVSYNNSCEDYILSESDFTGVGFRDFKAFATYKDACSFMSRIADKMLELDTLLLKDTDFEYFNEYGHSSYFEEVKEEFGDKDFIKSVTDEELIFILTLMSSFFCTPRGNYSRLRYIHLTRYKENFQLLGKNIYEGYRLYFDEKQDYIIEVKK